ncbi:hypothetical protein E3N88_38506 [Mikania micrantha]|uniref:Uncharacterized protein n=1 Tax=Mikania micrantha TaxID=192012 RepID=A0A5N6LU82_9ASTR|nr:hypothetical protein E3N88_38506 [Mikania micrantha]
MPMYFINLRLEGDYPIPTLSAVWKCYRNNAAGEWETIYQERIHRTWHEPGVVHVAGFILFILFVEWETVKPCTVFGGVFFYLLPPSGERPDLKGVYVTRIARFRGLIDIEPADLEAVHPVRLDSRTMHGMHIVQKLPHLGLRFALEKGSSKIPRPSN